MPAARPGFHRCPRKGCSREVPNSIFCCADDWMALGQKAQRAIVATRGQGAIVPTRRLAFKMAQESWARRGTVQR